MATTAESTDDASPRLSRKRYEGELLQLQAELVSMPEWVRAERARLLVILEGRDAAGEGSAITRVTQSIGASDLTARVRAPGAPATAPRILACSTGS